MTSLEDICNKVPMIEGNGTLTIDCNNQLLVHAHIKADGNVTIEVENFADTMIMYLMTEQDAVGGHTISFSSNFIQGNMPTPSAGANLMDSWIWGVMHGKFHRHGFESDIET